MASKPSTIAVVLWAHLGDIVLYSCIFESIRKRFPEDRVILLTSPLGKTLFGASPDIDQVIALDDLVLGP